ncbi:MAG: Ig-like domain-containing protein, partial [Pseudomonadota bacterium]
TSIADGDTTPDVADGTDFGAVGGTGTVERTFVIANDGTAVLNVSNVTVTGAGASDFTIQPGSFTSGAVQPGQTETVTILFDPAASGTSTATVSIFSDDADEATYDFAITGTADVTAPTLTASDPVDDATGISIGANIVLTFDEPVAAGSGNITLRTALGTVEAFDVNGPRVTVSGNTITLDPTALLDFETGYFVTVDATAVTDIAGNPFAGISNQTTLNFTTEIFVPDTVAPSLTGSTPADDATGVAVDSDIALTFDEPVQAGTGQIVIRLASDDSVVETITVPSGQVIVSGSTVTVNPSVTLAEGTEVYVTVSSGAIEDLAGNDFGGFSAPTDLNFTTVAGSTGGTSLPTPPVFDAGDPAYLPGATVGTSADDVLLGTAAGAKLDGKAGNDTIFSDGGNPTIRGRTGDDTIVGAGGNENIDADEDNDTVFGQGGNDKIKGGTGNDTIIGGLGDDVLDGEGGNDIIGFGEGADDVEGGGGADTFVYVGNGAGSEIEDFNTAEGDVLDLTNATTGSGPASNFVQLVDQGSTTLVRINADGQGTDFADAFTFGGDAANKDLTTLVNDGDLLV